VFTDFVGTVAVRVLGGERFGPEGGQEQKPQAVFGVRGQVQRPFVAERPGFALVGPASAGSVLEVRLVDDLSWTDWIQPYESVSDGESKADPVDVDDVTEIRGRVVNQDGNNTADVRLVLQTE